MAEVLVALAFLGVITVGMTGLAIAILNGNAKARDSASAVYLAHDCLEKIRNTAYASIAAANCAPIAPNIIPPNFQRTVLIQNNTPIAGMKRIMVTVSWPNGSVTEEMLVGQ